MSFLNPKRWYHSLGKRRFYEALLLIVFILFFYGPLLYTFMLAFANNTSTLRLSPLNLVFNGGIMY
jgi:putative spermidine/putrescine transport system permease protein